MAAKLADATPATARVVPWAPNACRANRTQPIVQTRPATSIDWRLAAIGISILTTCRPVTAMSCQAEG